MRRTSVAVLAVAALLALLPAAALAGGKDRNHDRIPDRWEKAHGLSLKVKQTRRDQDGDGLRNLAEYRHDTDPRDADSDDDGLRDRTELRHGDDPADSDSDDDGREDGDENAGTVASFADGRLVIALPDGTEVAGLVTDATELECEGGPVAAASSDDEGDDDGDDSGDDDRSGDSGDDDRSGDSGDDGEDSGDRGDEDESDEGDEHACPEGALTAGAVVHEAELELRDGQAVWHEVEIRL